jgi:hypothetical protein
MIGWVFIHRVARAVASTMISLLSFISLILLSVGLGPASR